VPITKDQSTKKINLNLSGLTEDQKQLAKERAGEIIIDYIQESLDQGKSPVKGFGRFKRLSAQYANDFKGGDRNPDLFLDGDMREQIEFKTTSTGIEVGIFDSAPKIDRLKASGHNRGDSASKVQRRFIPSPNQKFDDSVMREINSEINDIRQASESDDLQPSEIFTDDALDSIILRILSGES